MSLCADDDAADAPTASHARAAALPWGSSEWQAWSPFSESTPASMPPVAIAALADAVAARGQPPSCVISALRSELAENLTKGTLPATAEEAEEAAISRLELEMCHGPPRDKCAKCRSAPRQAQMVHCGHPVLCSPCASAVQAHVDGRHGMSANKLCRLLCPYCRGFERVEGAHADAIFAIVDTNQSGTIEPAELLVHLLVAGQEPETIADLFLHLDRDGDGVISPDEWRAGYERFVALSSHGPAHALQAARAQARPPLGCDLDLDDAADTDTMDTGLMEAAEKAHGGGGSSIEAAPREAAVLASSTACAITSETPLAWQLSLQHGSRQLPMELILSVPVTPR